MFNVLPLFGINEALASAQSAVPPTPGQGLMSMLPLMIVFFVGFYFLVIRPQNKRAKEHRDLLNNIAVGDEVVTSGGVLGKVSKLHDNLMTVKIADNVEVVLQKNAVVSVLPKGTLSALE